MIKIRNAHRRRVIIIDFAWMTRLKCWCHLLNAGDLVCLCDHVDLVYKHKRSQEFFLEACLSPSLSISSISFPLHSIFSFVPNPAENLGEY